MFKPHLRRTNRRPIVNNVPPQGLANAQVRTGRCVALIDARFLSWLTQGHDDRSDRRAVAPASGVLAQLSAALLQAGLDLELVRTYWYTDQTPTQPVDDLIQRSVLDPDTDGGMSLMRAMGGDLMRLATNHATEHVLVVSDDERLLPAVDEAQLHGLGVHLLVDDASNDFAKLMGEDPSWGRLLAQADRRVLMVAANGMPGNATRDQRAADVQDTVVIQASITQELQAWWDEEPETQRIDLQDELRFSSSIPQEVDRQLLLRLSRNLGHPLSWPEKRVMRESVRRIVLGDEFTPYKSEPGTGGMSGAAGTTDTGTPFVDTDASRQ